MSDNKIEQFWRDATAEDVMNGKEIEARFRDDDRAQRTKADHRRNDIGKAKHQKGMALLSLRRSACGQALFGL
jgi:hypothetical protein